MQNRNDEIVKSLRSKIDAIEKKAQEINTSEANEIKEKAVDILNRVTNKFIEASRNVLTSQEYEQGFLFVEKKSDELFRSAMNKLEQIEPKKVEVKAPIKQEAIDEMDSFIQETIRKEKEVPVLEEPEEVNITDLERKAINKLKEWLSPGKDA